MKEDNKITILYQIKGIRPSVRKNGYVEVLMSPMDKWDLKKEEDNLPVKITGIGPDGGMLPPELMKQMNQLMKDALPHHMRQREKDPRTLLHVESEIEFMARGWKYGDTISITLEKVNTDNIDNKL